MGFPPENDKQTIAEFDILLKNSLKKSFFSGYTTADKYWSLNAKATRAAFLADTHVVVFHIKTRKTRLVLAKSGINIIIPI